MHNFESLNSKNWSGQNRTGQTAFYGHALMQTVMPLEKLAYPYSITYEGTKKNSVYITRAEGHNKNNTYQGRKISVKIKLIQEGPGKVWKQGRDESTLGRYPTMEHSEKRHGRLHYIGCITFLQLI